MSDPSSDNKIIIKFEIHVPTGTGQPPVVLQPGAPPVLVEAARASSGKPPRALGVDLPSGVAKVKPQGTGTNVICATSSTDEDPFFGVPDEVYLYIPAPSESVPVLIPDDETPPGVRANPTGGGGSFFQWEHLSVPGALCANPSSGATLPWNRLVVWRRFDFWPYWVRKVVNFQGECSTLTDCEVGPFATTHVRARRTIDTAPRAYHVVARGFGGALALLNNTWKLERCDCVTTGATAWSNGGDGHTRPEVDLSGNSCKCDAWQLHMRCGGKQLTYLIAHDQFNPLGVNRLLWSGDRTGLEDCQFPKELQVVPA